MEMNQDRLIIFLVVVIAISCIALLYAWMLYCSVKKEDPGSRKLKELSSFIHEGAMAFLKREYKIIILFIAAVAVILCSLGMIPSLQGCTWSDSTVLFVSLSVRCAAVLPALSA